MPHPSRMQRAAERFRAAADALDNSYTAEVNVDEAIEQGEMAFLLLWWDDVPLIPGDALLHVTSDAFDKVRDLI